MAMYELNTVRRIAVVRALHLGDLLLAVPALRALRARFPAAELTLIGLPWAASFAQRYRRYVDRFLTFPGYPGINEAEVDMERTERFLAEQRAYGYDLVVQMHGSGRTSNPFALALGGRMTLGYYEADAVGLLPYDGLDMGIPYPEQLHEVYRNLGLVAMPGGSGLDPKLEFPLFDEDRAEAATLLRALARADRPWIGLHPGSHAPARRWPVASFAHLGDELVRRYDAQVLLTGGPGEEATVQEVVERMQMGALNLAGKTSLGGLAALIAKLDLFISNDTGPAHVANAVDTPSITIFGPAEYRRWAPLDQERHRVIRHPVPCSPCGYRECPIDHRCLRRIHPEQVLNIAEELLNAICAKTSTGDWGKSKSIAHNPDDN